MSGNPNSGLWHGSARCDRGIEVQVLACVGRGPEFEQPFLCQEKNRRTRSLEYAQADIMELNILERRFDLIKCAGVLHHMRDPLAGWKILTDLLRPGGIMRIGLYSEAARQCVVDGRARIVEDGYTTSSEDIRRCRQDFVAMAEDGNPNMAKICSGQDFFSLSLCRDPLFHVQEHRFALPRLDDALKSLDLRFLGFEMQDQDAIRKFKAFHPKKDDLTSLPLWNRFELENPDTFVGMYLFWCRKMRGGLDTGSAQGQ